jgi:hypothetical protein
MRLNEMNLLNPMDMTRISPSTYALAEELSEDILKESRTPYLG